MGNTLPVSMAAQAVDELIEAIEMEEKSGALEAITGYENGSVQDKAGLPFPPPPPPKFNQNAYNQVRVLLKIDSDFFYPLLSALLYSLYLLFFSFSMRVMMKMLISKKLIVR